MSLWLHQNSTNPTKLKFGQSTFNDGNTNWAEIENIKEFVEMYRLSSKNNSYLSNLSLGKLIFKIS